MKEVIKMNTIYDLYKSVEPIAEMIENKKSMLQKLTSDVEADGTIPNDMWEIVEELRAAIMNLSESIEELKQIAEDSIDV